jgi:hypothetical protein
MPPGLSFKENMQNFHRISAGVDVTPLMLAIKRRPDLWKEDTYLRDYPQGPFAQIESIMLRFPVKTVYETEEELKDHNSRYDQHENIDYPAYKVLHEARPIIRTIFQYVNGERLGRVMINKIAPGGVIFPHTDTKDHTDYYTRFHVVLQSQPGVVFRAGEEKVYMGTGEVWWFDNSKEHEVINNSADDRIHMIIDVRTSR